MRNFRQLGVLAGMLISFPVLLCPQDTGPPTPAARNPPAKPREDNQARVASSSRAGGSAAEFHRIAEAKAATAAALRRKLTRQDLSAAITLLMETARLFQAGGEQAKATEAYLGIGEIYFTIAQYGKALASYREALTLAGNDRGNLCQAQSRIARIYASTGRSSEANNYKEALSLCAALSNPRTQAEALEAQGETLFWSGKAVESVEPLSRARDLFAQEKDDDGEALALLMLGEARWERERLEAQQLLRQALQLWSSNGNGYGVAKTLSFLGTSSAFAGQFDTARCNAKQARDVFQAIGDKDSEAITLNILGYTSMKMGDAEGSLGYYRKARAAFASANDPLGEATAISGMARALAAMHRDQELLPLYEARLHIAQQLRYPTGIASAQGEIGDVYLLKRRYGKAEAYYLSSLRGFQQAHKPMAEGTGLIRLGHLYNEEEKYSQAISFLDRARPLKEKAGQIEELAKIDYELAGIYRRLGRVDEALQAIQRTIGIIESQRLKMSAFDSRASYFASVHKYYSLYIQLLMLLGQDPQLHSAVEALEASERSKVRSLLDWLAGSQQDAPCDELLKRQLETADSKSSQATDSNAQPPTEAAPALTLEQVRAEIADDDAILLEYTLGDEKSYLWVVNRDQISAHELPAAKRLAELVHVFRNSLTAPQRRAGETNNQYLARRGQAERDYRRSAAELSRLLLGPVLPGSAKRLIIVPDGPLQYVPFAALSVPAQNGGSALLAADHEVVILPSASALGAIRKAAASRPPPTLPAAVFADPVFGRDDRRISARGAPARGGQRTIISPPAPWRTIHPGSRYIPALPGSGKEAEAISQNLGPDGVFIASGFLASRETVLNHDLGRYRILHFATHGILDEKHPEQSGLILSLINQQGEKQDGYLKLNDIYSLKLSADVVVLSSCDSGLGQDLSSEGIIGLPRAFLRAGAKSVIATLWKVDDEATAKLMTYFYSRMHQGESPASALRHAQIELSQDKRWSHPYYWAAFVFQGDYRLSGLN